MINCKSLSSGAVVKCVFHNIAVRCNNQYNQIICNEHLKLLFGVSLVKGRIITDPNRSRARNLTYLAPDVYMQNDYKVFPFPYRIHDGKVCRLPALEDMYNEMYNWVSRLSLDNEQQMCQLAQVLTSLFSGALVTGSFDASYLQQHQTYMNFVANNERSLNARFNNTSIVVYDGETSIDMSMKLMPPIIKALLFHAEASGNRLPSGEMVTTPFTLVIDFKKRAIVLTNYDLPEAPMAYWDNNKGTTAATMLTFAGSSNDDPALLYSRSFANSVQFRMENTIALCNV